MTDIRFGPAGNSDSFYAAGFKATIQAFAWLEERGLDAFEYPFGRGVALSRETAEAIGREAARRRVRISAHAPYYINLADPSEEARQKSLNYILEAALRLCWMGGERLVVHVGAQKKLTREDALRHSGEGLMEALGMLEKNGLPVRLCVETMGKRAQIGDLDEVLGLCLLDARLMPCVDFAHLHALGQGALQTQRDFADILDKTERVLGAERASGMHIHFSTVEYTAAGEKMHRTFAESRFGPRFEMLSPLLAERKYTPTVICESRGTQAEDAAAMRQCFLQDQRAARR